MKRTLSIPVVVLIAVVALVLGTFGSATAAGITKGTVKKIAAKVVDKKASSLSVAKAVTATKADSATTAGTVSDNAITSAKIANGAVTKDDLAPGTLPTSIFARVNEDGTLAFGSNVVTSVRTSTGRYDVTFNRDLSKCAAVAETFAFDQGDTVIVAQSTGGVVTVDIESPDTANTQTDQPFNLLVLC